MLPSSLRLSPAAVTVLHALTQTIPYASAAASESENTPADPPSSRADTAAPLNAPRTDDASARTIARVGKGFQIRIDTNPDGTMVAFCAGCAVEITGANRCPDESTPANSK